MRKTSDNKWFFIGVGFLAIFIIITAIIITSKVSEYNNSKNTVTSTPFITQKFESSNDIFTN